MGLTFSTLPDIEHVSTEKNLSSKKREAAGHHGQRLSTCVLCYLPLRCRINRFLAANSARRFNTKPDAARHMAQPENMIINVIIVQLTTWSRSS